MNFRLLLSALVARSRLFFLILATTVVATLIISLIMPKTYIAKVALLLDGKDEQSMRSTNVTPERERAGYMQTQVDIISSPKVAHRVIADLKLTENPLSRAAFDSAGSPGTIEEWLAESLLKQLKIDTSSSSIIQLSYSSDDARYSAQVANAVAKAYVDTVLELRVEPTRQTSIWFDEQLKELRNNMAQAESRLTAFQQEHGIVHSDERFDVENIQLTDLAGLAARSREPAGPETNSNAGLQILKTDLMRSEAKLQELSTDLGNRHPQYLRQLAEVQALRARISSEARNAIASAEQATQRSRERREKLFGEMEAQRQRVLGLKEARNQLAVLSHDVEISQKTYDSAMQRFMESRIESRAMQTNVSILNPATTPSRAARPKIGMNLGIALVVGALLALSVVYLLELSDQRVRLIEDLSGNPRVPLLAVLTTWNPAEPRLLTAPSSHNALPEPG